MSNDLVPVQTDANTGPALAALNERQQLFVRALVETGCSNTRAAEMAGFSGDRATLKATGWRLAHDARVQVAIHEQASRLIRSSAIMAVHVLEELASGSYYEPRVRLKAATELLSRSGLSAITEHHVQVEHTVNEAQQVASIRRLADQLGLDPAKLLGNVGYVVDAEFVEVHPTDDDEWTVQPDADHG
jgi:phage terminase small subunit